MRPSPKIFVPDRCRVGFQERKGTFTGLLAYVIYYGPKGEIRKETSWKGWCKLDSGEPRLEPRDFENEPTGGFVLNKGIQRYSWSHFSSGRSMVRLYDPRGWEFEISPINLVMILMHVDCSKREICDEMVYAWTGGDLVLLPCNSTVFKEARSFSDLQAQKISSRDLVPGATYVTKKETAVVYLGRHMFFEDKDDRSHPDYGYKRVGKKCHMFRDQQGGWIAIPSVPSKIAAVDTPHCHDSYAEWLEAYLADPISSAIIDWEMTPMAADDLVPKKPDQPDHYVRGVGCCLTDQVESGFQRGVIYTAAEINEGPFWKRPDGFFLRHDEQLPDGDTVFIPRRRIERDGSWRYNSSRFPLTRNPEPERLVKLHALYENGAKKEW